jgi:hypothetical protein
MARPIIQQLLTLCPSKVIVAEEIKHNRRVSDQPLARRPETMSEIATMYW